MGVSTEAATMSIRASLNCPSDQFVATTPLLNAPQRIVLPPNRASHFTYQSGARMSCEYPIVPRADWYYTPSSATAVRRKTSKIFSLRQCDIGHCYIGT
jgi:hypothetical protein